MKIETQEWDYTCGDGCCYNWGVSLFIDGKKLEDREFSDIASAYEYVLTELLGHEVDSIIEDDYDE